MLTDINSAAAAAAADHDDDVTRQIKTNNGQKIIENAAARIPEKERKWNMKRKNIFSTFDGSHFSQKDKNGMLQKLL